MQEFRRDKKYCLKKGLDWFWQVLLIESGFLSKVDRFLLNITFWHNVFIDPRDRLRVYQITTTTTHRNANKENSFIYHRNPIALRKYAGTNLFFALRNGFATATKRIYYALLLSLLHSLSDYTITLIKCETV